MMAFLYSQFLSEKKRVICTLKALMLRVLIKVFSLSKQRFSERKLSLIYWCQIAHILHLFPKKINGCDKKARVSLCSFLASDEKFSFLEHAGTLAIWDPGEAVEVFSHRLPAFICCIMRLPRSCFFFWKPCANTGKPMAKFYNGCWRFSENIGLTVKG